MIKKVHVLFAVRDARVAEQLRLEMDDEENCTFHVTTSGPSAIAEAGRFFPDILVADDVLEGMDGLGLIERMNALSGGKSLRIIGGAISEFGRRGFAARGAAVVLKTPWNKEELRSALLLQLERIEHDVDWARSAALQKRACRQLTQMGMSEGLKGYEYLAWAAALAHENEARLYAVGRRIYQPIAEHFSTTPQSVERLIRHAVESMMNTGRARGVYLRFGNTIDPSRGKPTNAQAIAVLAQRLNAMERS